MRILTQLAILFLAISCQATFEQVGSIGAIVDNSIPNPPSNVLLSSPTSSPLNYDQAVFSVVGVEFGDTVNLYTDASCTLPGLVSTGVASGVSIDLTVSGLAEGSYDFYAKRINSLGMASPCSSSFANYVYDSSLPRATLCDLPSDNLSPFYSGDGSSSPYVICTVAHLREISGFSGQQFILQRDINLIGEQLDADFGFRGVFDGDSFTIDNLNFNGVGAYFLSY